MTANRVFVLVWIVTLVVCNAAAGGDDSRSAHDIIVELDHVLTPPYNYLRRQEPGYLDEFNRLTEEARSQRSELIGELYQCDPDHVRLVSLLPERWNYLLTRPELRDGLNAEMTAVIERNPTGEHADGVRFTRAMMLIRIEQMATAEKRNLAGVTKAIDAFMRTTPGDERGLSLLNQLAGLHVAGSDKQIAVFQRIKRDFPDSPRARYVDGAIKQARGINNPFELQFTDAISNKPVNMTDLRGKVVIIDFWATWCGPCVREMPKLKELYADYHDQGVEFIGISLDQPQDKGGLVALKKFVEDREIPWLQYYQGKGWTSEFSSGWGINSIPTMFAVDKKGNLRSVTARGELETLIPELLAE